MTDPSGSGDSASTPQARLSSDLGPRAASSVVMIAAALSTLWLGGDVFILFWLGCALALHWEWQGIIDALYVEQEVRADETPAFEAVLMADKIRWALIVEERQLITELAAAPNEAKDSRLAEVYEEVGG